ncbi:MAE_28990/MAE_18760 family HEPN-like nuclease [Trichormus sp. NMC-1]|uniref:MAE_28990/MAE_18760 family HEPN-like nuclease n=1 Tax=Trichormus sp. NMC-1 TaxID=1853259 RepID=UPI0008DC18D3|nr:MAE_28990/MAE_18760 family HEPN-like nuclease [Trichormus sp. NMC-1]
MQSALDQFRISIQRVRDLIALHNSFKAQATAALDISDILRSAIVLSVSALDYYVHEVVTLGMLEIHRGTRSEPAVTPNANQSAFARFKVSLGSAREDRRVALEISSWIESEIQQTYGDNFLQQSHHISSLIPIISNNILNQLNNNSWLENEIRKEFSKLSFQTPDNIADAMRYISNKKLWDEVAIQISGNVKQANQIKQQLILIVDRRNKIAHQADIDPTLGLGNRWPIDELLVNNAVDFIEQVVESIHQIL